MTDDMNLRSANPHPCLYVNQAASNGSEFLGYRLLRGKAEE